MTAKTQSVRGTKPNRLIKGKRKVRVIGGLTRPALTKAINAPTSPDPEVYGYEIQAGRLFIKPEPIHQVTTKKLSRIYSIKKLHPVDSALVVGGNLSGRKSKTVTSQLLDSSKPIIERLRMIGAEPGSDLDDAKVAHVLSSIQAGAKEVTGSLTTARNLLANNDFDGTGLTAEQLVRKGRSGRILSRLDDLRYGARD